MCLECHNGAGNFGPHYGVIPQPSSTHNLADPRYQNCTTCHVRIHGSNADALFSDETHADLHSSHFAVRLAARSRSRPSRPPTSRPALSRRQRLRITTSSQSFELGYRFATVGGDGDMYRSTVNYTDGIRLLSSSLSSSRATATASCSTRSAHHHAGPGQRPYQSAILRIEKNRLYRYDMIWRSDALLRSGG